MHWNFFIGGVSSREILAPPLPLTQLVHGLPRRRREDRLPPFRRSGCRTLRSVWGLASAATGASRCLTPMAGSTFCRDQARRSRQHTARRPSCFSADLEASREDALTTCRRATVALLASCRHGACVAKGSVTSPKTARGHDVKRMQQGDHKILKNTRIPGSAIARTPRSWCSMPVGHWGSRAGTVVDAEPCSQVSCALA